MKTKTVHLKQTFFFTILIIIAIAVQSCSENETTKTPTTIAHAATVSTDRSIVNAGLISFSANPVDMHCKRRSPIRHAV
jgi:hypothetical protein